MSYRAHIQVTCRPGVLDPEGKAVKEALERLGFTGVGRTRVGKLIEIDLGESDETAAGRVVERMCTELLAHPVVERYSYRLEPRDAEVGEP
ncbi:MAG: phosphoribosylformylglycinamidine synthase subunit PurS [bacterium]|nr:phosphoribosylformylglycinamidine synthase subunit PurS [bacterium]